MGRGREGLDQGDRAGPKQLGNVVQPGNDAAPGITVERRASPPLPLSAHESHPRHAAETLIYVLPSAFPATQALSDLNKAVELEGSNVDALTLNNRGNARVRPLHAV